MRACFGLAQVLCTIGPVTRTAWLTNQRDAALASAALRALPARNSVLSSAYDSIAKQYPSRGNSEGDSDDDVSDAEIVVELELPQALALIRAHGAPTLAAVKEARSFLYRGAALAEDGRPRLVVERSDLLDEGTYGSESAAEYFGTVDAVMSEEFRAPARPSTAHIMVSDKEAAAEWGTACSVWPLGDTLDFSWLDNCAEWWDSTWDRPGGRSSGANEARQAFVWRDVGSLHRFLQANLRVNTGLSEGIRRRHEILVRSGEFSIRSKQTRGIGEPQIIVRDAFVCIPASLDDAVGRAFGL